ncbi:head-tail connector protein [Larkinella harenae]
MLVSLQQASDHLRRDTTDDDSDLELKIHAASAAVINYLKAGATFLDTSGGVPLDTSGNPVGVPYEVQAAVLLMLGVLYRDRDGQEMSQWELGYLPRPVMALLYPLRDPAMS